MIVDADYSESDNSGHIWVKLRNETDRSKTLSIQKGEAIAQAIFQKYLLVEEDEFKGEKRNGGFGSTDFYNQSRADY